MYFMLQTIEDCMRKEGIIKYGHFKLTSGLHSDTYVQKDKICTVPYLRSMILSEITSKLFSLILPYNIDAITGPAVAGLSWASPVADRLKLPLVYPEKTIDGSMKFGREFPEFIKGKRILQIEDIITTSKSITQTKNAIEECDGTCIGVIAIWNRQNWQPPSNWIFYSIINQYIESWKKNECPYCKKNQPLVNPKTNEIL